MAITKVFALSQIGFPSIFEKDNWLVDFELSRLNEDPVIGDSLDAATQMSCPPLACQFCPVIGQEHKFAVADELGYIVLYDTRLSLSHSNFDTFAAHDNAIFDVSWFSSQPHLVTASGDQTLALMDMNTCDVIETFRAHTGSVKSVDVLQSSNSVFASGSRDGHIMIWDARCNKKGDTIPPVNIIKNAHCVPLQSASKTRKRLKLGPALDNQQSVTTVLYQSDVNLVSSGAVDGVIKLWDLRKNYCICGNEPLAKITFPYPGHSERKRGYSSMSFDSYNTRLYVNCTDDAIYEYDMATYSTNPIQTYTGHMNKTFYVKSTISPDNQFILTGSSDSTAYIYKVGNPQKNAVVLKEHRNEVTAVAWCPTDFTKLVTLSDDNMVRLWTLIHRTDDCEKVDLYGKAEIQERKPSVTPLKTSKVNFMSPKPSPSPSSSRKRKPTPNTKQNVMSPTITQWFSKDLPKRKIADDWPKSPAKTMLSQSKLVSPRKLIISPMKSPGRHCVFNQYGKVDVTPHSANDKIDLIRTASCKRKLIDGNDDVVMSPVKKQFLEDISCGNNSIINEDECNTIISHITVTPKSNRKQFIDNSLLNHSPTANLPNFVIDGPRHVPILKRSEMNKENNQMDWLTKYRLEKHGFIPFANYSPSRRKVYMDSATETSSIESSPGKPIPVSPIPGVPSILNFFKQKQ